MLMSLQPQWSEAILSRQKTIELRRTPSGCEPGTPIVIYTSYPVKRVEGRCRVRSIIQGAPEMLWERVKDECGCSRAEFDAYLDGAEVAYGIVLSDVERIAPVALPFNGPQSYRYLFDDEPDQLKVLKAAGIADPAVVNPPARA